MMRPSEVLRDRDSADTPAMAQIVSRPTIHYVLALFLVALAAVASHSILVYSLSQSDKDSVAINVSGRQRMLSEQTLRMAGELAVVNTAEDRRALQNQLRSSLALMRESHEQISTDVRTAANPSQWDLKLRSAYFAGTPSLDDRLSAYFAAVEAMLANGPDASVSDQAAYRSVVDAHREGLLRDLDQIVLIYEEKARSRLRASENLHLSLMLGILALLLAEAIFIFRPLVRREVRAKEEALSARDQAQTELAARTNILAAVSHEIRTPLGGIVGIIEQLKRERSPVERARALELVKESCQALNDTLDAMLQQSRLGHGSDGVADKLLRPRALANRVAELFRPMARRKALAIEVKAATNREARGDDARIQQVLANLVSNSVKFTQSGVVTITVQEPAPGTTQWAFTVTDTGSGMDEKRVKAMFEPYGHSADDTLGRAKGAGLGLSITRDIVDAAGGRIDVQSELGHGTSITVFLPLGDVPDDPAEASAQASNGCVMLLIDRASDWVQAEAVATQSGYTVCDLATRKETDLLAAGEIIIIADAALLSSLDEDLVEASHLLIVLGDNPPTLAAQSGHKSVVVSHNQLARSLGKLLQERAA